MTDSTHEAVIVGGGAAGLSAALVLGRARRRTLVLDEGAQSNRAAAHIGGLLGHDGWAPDEFYRQARAEIGRYPTVEVRELRVTGVEGERDGFTVALSDGTTTSARRVLVASGMDYVYPDLPGVAELWGRSVFHCPFCDGFEHRDGRLAVLGSSDLTVFQAGLLRGWSEDVVLLSNGGPPPGAGKLRSAGVRVESRPLARLRADGDRLAAVVFADGAELPRDGLLVHAPLRQRGRLLSGLGMDLTPAGTVVVDDHGETSRAGIFAAGDVAAPIQQVARAVGAGATAAVWMAHELITSEHGIELPQALPKAPPAAVGG